jgi:serine/threonine protein kinase
MDVATQIVTTWYRTVLHTSSIHTSLQSCRTQMGPTCTWDHIGAALQLLLDYHLQEVQPLIVFQLLGLGNSHVLLGRYGTRLVAVKQHVLVRGSWEVSAHMLRESLLLRELTTYTWSPQLYVVSVSQDMVQIGMEYLPLSTEQMLAHPLLALTQLLGAVAALHRHGVAHCDLKPDNIRFRANGDLVLIDFDTSVWLNRASTGGTRRIGTPAYRDPYLSEDSCDLTTYDYRSLDAYAIGAVGLFFFNGGTHVFTHQCARTYDVHAQNTHVPDKERSLLAGLLAPSPSARWSVTRAHDVCGK